jgi:hypothetical protein
MTDRTYIFQLRGDGADLRAATDAAGKKIDQLASKTTQYGQAAGVAGQAAAKGFDANGEAAKKATGHVEAFSFATAGAKRELLVLAYELSQGNYSRFGGPIGLGLGVDRRHRSLGPNSRQCASHPRGEPEAMTPMESGSTECRLQRLHGLRPVIDGRIEHALRNVLQQVAAELLQLRFESRFFLLGKRARIDLGGQQGLQRLRLEAHSEHSQNRAYTPVVLHEVNPARGGRRGDHAHRLRHALRDERFCKSMAFEVHNDRDPRGI